MDVEERMALIKEVGEEIVNDEQLKELLSTKKRIVAYDGFEPSGKLHIAQGILRAINVNKLTKAGIHFTFFVADWHAWANNKLGGRLEDIQTAGKYQIEVWKACGMDMKNVKFAWASDLVQDEDYWKIVMDVARANTVKRIIRCSQIMGRTESDALSAAQILYPCMQAADIFYLKADITQLGMDQRKVNVLAREVGQKLGFWKPVIISHHMLMGLSEPPKDVKDSVERATAMKMSKSNPNSAIFMTDSAEVVEKKLKKAYGPPGQTNDNPLLEYCKYMIFEKFDCMKISRPEKFGGDMIFDRYADLENAYGAGELHPGDLKPAIAKYINELLEPVRAHFSKGDAKKLLENVEKLSVTR